MNAISSVLMLRLVSSILLGLTCWLTPSPAAAQFRQQGNKLVGTEASGSARQGTSVAISRDGKTILAGGMLDSGGVGASWVFTRSVTGWVQQGTKLNGYDATGFSQLQGNAVALSGDGNTAIVGGYYENAFTGSAWVYTRSGGVWTQQGSKFSTTDGVAGPELGSSVAISADGNTALVGGRVDDNGIGAAWVYTRSGGVWTQQGSKLVGTGGAAGGAWQGSSVSLSADGNTALVGGRYDGATFANPNGVGAVWVFTRTDTVWTQQGSKLVGTGSTGDAAEGFSACLSADGNTALFGGPSDNGGVGAAWVFTRSGGVWSQQGSKLVGTGAVGSASQGLSVSLSAHGDTAIVGGGSDSSTTGAAWVFVRSGGVWSQLGGKLLGKGTVGSAAQGYGVALSADGQTAVVGGWNDSSAMGATWVFTDAASAYNAVSGWNLLSVPVVTGDPRKSSVYLGAISPAFGYQGSYQRRDTLQSGSGYWVKFGDAQALDYFGTPITQETIAVKSNWNLIGSIGSAVAVSGITSDPGGIGTSPFFKYSGAYTVTDSIRPGLAYWVRAHQDGKLILNSSPSNVPSNRIRIADGPETPPPPPGTDALSPRERIPSDFALSQNYPNPFNPSTILHYQLPVRSTVKIRIYNTIGENVATLADGTQDAGYQSTEWDAGKNGAASGVYFYRLEAVSALDPTVTFTATGKMILVR